MERAGRQQIVAVFVYSRSGNHQEPVSWQATKHATPQSVADPAELQHVIQKVHLHNSVPVDNDPLASAKGIDPFMRLETTLPLVDSSSRGLEYLPRPHLDF
jgi:hypothetical protein